MKTITLYKRHRLIQLGTKNKSKQYKSQGNLYIPKNIIWESDFIQPKGVFWKRQANKKVRKSKVYSGSYYKKVYGWHHWG